MKKFILAAAFAAIGLTGLVSCNSDEPLADAPEQTHLQATLQDAERITTLQDQLKQLNNQQFGGRVYEFTRTSADPFAPQQKGRFVQFFKRFWKIVVADVVGALESVLPKPGWQMVSGAASASAKALSATLEVKATDNEVAKPLALAAPDGITLSLDTTSIHNTLIGGHGWGGHGLPTLSDSLGYYHNMAIIELNRHNPGWLKLNTFELSKELSYAINNVTGWSSKGDIDTFFQSDNSMVLDNEFLASLAANDDDVETMFAKLKAHYPANSAQFDVLFETIKGLLACEAEGDDPVEYSTKVLNLVEKAQLSKDLEGQLRAGIVVANASYQLWNSAKLK